MSELVDAQKIDKSHLYYLLPWYFIYPSANTLLSMINSIPFHAILYNT